MPDSVIIFRRAKRKVKSKEKSPPSANEQYVKKKTRKGVQDARIDWREIHRIRRASITNAEREAVRKKI